MAVHKPHLILLVAVNKLIQKCQHTLIYDFNYL